MLVLAWPEGDPEAMVFIKWLVYCDDLETIRLVSVSSASTAKMTVARYVILNNDKSTLIADGVVRGIKLFYHPN